MRTIDTTDALEALYGEPSGAAIDKVADRLTDSYARWVGQSRLCVLSTVGPEGTDGSPRGDDGPVARILDEKTLAIPDWRGNQRLDSLRNIVRDGRVSLMFMIAGSTTVIRVNGRAVLTDDDALRQAFARKSILPATVMVVTIHEVYPQCSRALMRAGIWSAGDQSGDLPTIGQMLSDVTEGRFDGDSYDRDWAARATRSMW